MFGDRPFVLLSIATSLDGHIDDTTTTRLLLSNDEDFDRVDAVRASVDAILVGGGTVRADDPRLLVRSPQRQQNRRAAGKPSSPVKVAVSESGNVDASARFFTTGDGDKLVYVAHHNWNATQHRLEGTATVVDAGDQLEFTVVLRDLAARGIARVMVEGGGAISTRFLTSGLVDQLDLVIAPFFIGDPQAPSFAGPGAYPNDSSNPLRLNTTRQMGDVVLLEYRRAPRPV